MWEDVHRFDYNQQDRCVFYECKCNFRLALMYLKIFFYLYIFTHNNDNWNQKYRLASIRLPTLSTPGYGATVTLSVKIFLKLENKLHLMLS